MLTAGCLIIFGIRPALLLPIWLGGSYAYFESNSRCWGPWTHWLPFLSPLSAIWIYRAHNTVLPIFNIDLGNSRQFLSDWGFGLLLMLHFLGAKNIGPQLARTLQWIALPLRALADYTFTLYLVHLPVMLFVAAAVGMNRVWTRPAIILVVGMVTALMGFLTERQRHWIKGQIEQAIIMRRRFVT